MTEYVIREVGLRQWLVFADRRSIAFCADEDEAVKAMAEHSARRGPALCRTDADQCSCLTPNVAPIPEPIPQRNDSLILNDPMTKRLIY
ncbi:hypothetical protein PMN64_09255 [Bradyrhizobium sp. UFLA01-814]|uniref:hypothetical protein n=1 Tax=Bradyrhizobium sp. UFLA01-814 TaxID=3023480 RepID=UPI00398BB6A5